MNVKSSKVPQSELDKMIEEQEHEINYYKKKIRKILDHDQKIHDFMYSKLIEVDKAHVDQLIAERKDL